MSQEPDMTHYASQLKKVYPITIDAIEKAIQTLAPQPGSMGLDAGCGIGHNAIRLAQAAGEGARIVGLDTCDEFLSVAREMADETGVAERCNFQVGDLFHLPMKDDSFDWLWCKDALWPIPARDGSSIDYPVKALKGFRRVVKPGGTIAILFWTTQVLLPGYPALEARLGVGLANSIPYLKVKKPEQHVMCALGWLKAAGLVNTRVDGFAACTHAPLGEEVKASVDTSLHMFYDDIKPYVSPEDWGVVSNLMDKNSKDYIVERPDYHCLLSYSMFRGETPEKKL